MLRSRPLSALAVAGGVAVAFAAAQLAGCFEPYELRTLDLRMRWQRDPSAFRDDVVFVFITDFSLRWSRKQHWSWPWPRDVYADLIDYAKEGGARCVASDIGYTEPDVNGAEKDRTLGESAAQYGRYVLATPFTGEKEDAVPVPDEFRRRFSLRVEGSLTAPEAVALVPPVDEVWKGTKRIASPRVHPDPDGTNRRYALLVKHDGAWYPSLALGAFLEATGETSIRAEPGALVIGNRRVPVDEEGRLLLLYGRATGDTPQHDAAKVLSSRIRRADGLSYDLGPEIFKDKIVIIAAQAAGLKDLRVTPLSEADAGAVIHGTAVSNLLNGDFLRRAPRAASLGLLAALCAAVALATRLLPLPWGIAGSAAALAAYLAVATLAFRGRLWLDVVPPVSAVVVCFGAASALNYLVEGRERRETRRAFSRYLAPGVVDKILANPLKLEGERKELTLLFLDFAGFTTLSEQLEAGALVSLLIEHNNEIVDELWRHEGTLDKFIGDAVMAFWNDPVPQADHARRALLAAVGIQERMASMAARTRERGLAQLTARIGINTGTVTVGNMGARAQFTYTAIGDEVNLASRLEGVNKEFGTAIIASEATVSLAREAVEVRELALIKVKGKKLPVRIFEVLGRRGEVAKERLEGARRFEGGLGLFRERRWGEAKAAFAAGSDPASALYAGLCDACAKEPPPADWDGSYVMEHK